METEASKVGFSSSRVVAFSRGLQPYPTLCVYVVCVCGGVGWGAILPDSGLQGLMAQTHPDFNPGVLEC